MAEVIVDGRGSGNYLAINSDGSINVSGTAINYATSDNQTTIISRLDDIKTNTGQMVQSVENALSATAYDLLAAAYSATTTITNDYELDSIVLDFSTTQSKTITITTAQGTKLYEDTNTTQNLVISFKQFFNASENITVAVTQTAGACTMDLKMKIVKGSNTLAGNPAVNLLDENGTAYGVRHNNNRPEVEVRFSDSYNTDAFERLRISQPTGIFESQFTYDLKPLIFEQIVSGTGATVTHDTTDRCAKMTFSATPTGGKAYMQSYEYIRYQPGKSQLIRITFNFIEAIANCLKFVSYEGNTNGFAFQLNGTTKQFKITSATSVGSQTVTQTNWNLDKLDGTGASGYTLDITKSNHFVLDFEALYVGRVRMGFDFGGVIVYAHEFILANNQVSQYIQSANQPIKVGMTSTGTVSTTMLFHCCSVVSEGGQEALHGEEHAIEGTGTAGNGTRAHILSFRPKTLFNGFTNRTKYGIIEIDVLNNSSVPIKWELTIGQAITGSTTFTDVNTTYSSSEYNNVGTISGSPTIVIDSGYVAATNQAKGATNTNITSQYPITLDAAGAVRSLGTLSLLATGIGGTASTRALIKYQEIR